MEEKLKVTGLMRVLSFLVPFFGLLVYAIHCAENPIGASKCGKIAIWGLIIACTIVGIIIWSMNS